MKSERKPYLIAIFLWVVAGTISIPAGRAQQNPKSAQFGAGASRSGSTVGVSAPSQASAYGGASSWAAGKGSFGDSAQPGGVWHDDGPTLGALGGASSLATQFRPSGANPLPPSGSFSSGLSSSKAANNHGKPAISATHLTQFSPASVRGSGSHIRNSTSIPTGIRPGAGRSRGRVGSHSRGLGGSENRPTAGLSTSAPLQALIKNSSPKSELDIGLAKKHDSPHQ
jgi:hypothetical protein